MWRQAVTVILLICSCELVFVLVMELAFSLTEQWSLKVVARLFYPCVGGLF